MKQQVKAKYKTSTKPETSTTVYMIDAFNKDST